MGGVGSVARPFLMPDWRFNQTRCCAFRVLHAWKADGNGMHDRSYHVQGSQPVLPVRSLAPSCLPVLAGEGARASSIEVPQQIMEETMQCARCAGMNVPEVILDGGARFVAMRCLHCGDVIDQVILMNRRRSQYARLVDDRDHQWRDMISPCGADRH